MAHTHLVFKFNSKEWLIDVACLLGILNDSLPKVQSRYKKSKQSLDVLDFLTVNL